MFTSNLETMGDERNRYCFLKNKKLMTHTHTHTHTQTTTGWWEVLHSSQPFGPLQVDGYHPQRIFLGQ